MKKIIIILVVLIILAGIILLMFNFFKNKSGQQTVSSAQKIVTVPSAQSQPDVTDGAPAVGSPDYTKAQNELNTRLAEYPWTKQMPFFANGYTVNFDSNYNVLIEIKTSSATQEAQYLQEAQAWLKGQNTPVEKISQAIITYK